MRRDKDRGFLCRSGFGDSRSYVGSADRYSGVLHRRGECDRWSRDVGAMTEKAVVAVVQRAFGADRDENREATVVAVEEAIAQGADIVLPPELFEGRYFPQREEQEYFSWATTADDNPAIAAVQKVTAGTGRSCRSRSSRRRVRPISIRWPSSRTERCSEFTGRRTFPDGPGYEEKFYFTPGDTGFSNLVDPPRPAGRRDLLGSVVPRGRTRHGAAGRGRAPLPDGDRQRGGEPGRERHLGHVAAGHGGPRRVQSRARRGGQPDRQRKAN